MTGHHGKRLLGKNLSGRGLQHITVAYISTVSQVLSEHTSIGLFDVSFPVAGKTRGLLLYQAQRISEGKAES